MRPSWYWRQPAVVVVAYLLIGVAGPCDSVRAQTMPHASPAPGPPRGRPSRSAAAPPSKDSPSASAKVATEPASGTPSRIELNGQVELARLLDICAQRLDLQITYEAGAVKDTLTVRLPKGLTDQELWQLTNQILATKGLASVELPGSGGRAVSVIKLTDAPGLAKVERQGAEGSKAGFANLVTRVENQSTKSIVDAVKLVLSKPGGVVTDLGNGGLILISDLRPRVDEALALIETLDVPNVPPVIESIQTRFVGSSVLAALVTSTSIARDSMTTPGPAARGKVLPAPESNSLILICPPQETEFWKALITRFDQRQDVTTQTYAPKYYAAAEVAKLVEQVGHDASPRGSGDQWKVIIDDLSGSLIVTATPDEHGRIAELVKRLDGMPREARRPVKVFAIHNRGVRDFVDVLSKLLEAGILEGEGGDAEAGESAQAANEARTTTRLPSPVPSIVPSPSTASPNAADLSASSAASNRTMTSTTTKDTVARSSLSHPTNMSNQAVAAPPALTLTADEPTNSVIAIGEPRKLVELESLIRRLDVRQPQVMIEVMVVGLNDSDSLDLGIELQKLEIVGNTTIGLASLFGLGSPSLTTGTPATASKGGSAIVLSPGDFSVVIRALQELNKGRTLTLPRVLVNNNQQAKLDSVLQQPFVSTNASNTVATTSFGGSENAGTVITIKPQIAEADHLVLDYSVSLSAFVGEAADPTVPPPKQSNNLSSVVTIPDGYTVVVGGLEIASQADAVSQVPLLGSIPGIGEAFKNRSKSKNRSRFFVFIRSEVLRRDNFEDLKFISDENLRSAGVDDGWPDVEPRVIW